jgi:hypothetical protein
MSYHTNHENDKEYSVSEKDEMEAKNVMMNVKE